ncbi:MAG: hemerythrin domain-containing protein [Acidobacteria bacterium]|nr:hemerythrin domain-containing protein [Acidobacteriota bacterium]
MQRYDLYRNIHKGIRVMLFDLIQKAGRVDFRDLPAVARLRADTKEVFELLEGHAHKEDLFVMPLVRLHAPDVARSFDEQHEDQEARLPGLLAALEMLDTSAPDAPRRGHAFVVQLSRIAGELLTHMADEETKINAVLWIALTDDELAEVEQRIVGSIAPEMMGRFARWILPALNTPERVEFFAKARATAPAPAFQFLRGLAKQVLSPADDLALDAGLAVMTYA